TARPDPRARGIDRAPCAVRQVRHGVRARHRSCRAPASTRSGGGERVASPRRMRWDRDYDSPNVEDRRGEGGAGLGGGRGVPAWGLLAIAGRFGWKGIVIALIVVGLLSYSGSNLCSGSGA